MKMHRLGLFIPKFSLSIDRRVLLELNEKKWVERNIELKISHRVLLTIRIRNLCKFNMYTVFKIRLRKY